MTVSKLTEELISNIEYLETTEKETIPCISIENLEALLSKFFETEIKIT